MASIHIPSSPHATARRLSAAQTAELQAAHAAQAHLRPGYDWGWRHPNWGGIHTTVVDVQGVQIHGLSRAGRRDGTPHLLLHGLGGSAMSWLDVIADLSLTGPVLAVDLPGFGRTELPALQAADVEMQSRFVVALCRRLGWDQVILHGNSMGGLISTITAATFPDLVAGLVLNSPALPPPREALHRIPLLNVARFAPFMIPRLGTAMMREAWKRTTPEAIMVYASSKSMAQPDRMHDALRQVAEDNLHVARENPWRAEGFAYAAESIAKQWLAADETLARLDRIVAPTMLLWGVEDQMITAEIIDAVAARRPDWHIHRLEDCGHIAMQERPLDYAEIALSWLLTDHRRATDAAAGSGRNRWSTSDSDGGESLGREAA